MSSFYDANLPLFTSALKTLKTILQKAQSHAEETSLPADALLTRRLAPSMLPLAFQIHEVTDAAAQLVARAHGVPLPAWSDEDLKTMSDVWARIDAAEGWLGKADREVFERRADEKTVVGVLAMGVEKGDEVPVRGWVALYGIPTLFFHLSIAYGILRSEGVDLGKRDFIGAFAAPWISV